MQGRGEEREMNGGKGRGGIDECREGERMQLCYAFSNFYTF